MRPSWHTFALVCLTCLPLGCAVEEQQQAAPPALTGQHARDALVAMLRTRPQSEIEFVNTHFATIQPDDLALAPVEEREDGSCRIGMFWIDLRRARYDITFGGGCRFDYSGSFKLKGTAWVASPPRFESVGCILFPESP